MLTKDSSKNNLSITSTVFKTYLNEFCSMWNKMKTQKEKIAFDEFLNKLRIAVLDPLPGSIAHAKMNPPHRPMEQRIPMSGDLVRESAVLILLWPEADKISTVFILRTEYDGVHSNQIAFPGGKRELEDLDFVATALREAQEEVGIIPDSVTIIGQLSPLYIPVSQFVVYPIVGYTTTIPSFVPNPEEIKEIIPYALFDFLRPDAMIVQDIEIRDRILPNIPCYKIGEKLIWGATAMIFSELLDIIRPIVETGTN